MLMISSYHPAIPQSKEKGRFKNKLQYHFVWHCLSISLRSRLSYDGMGGMLEELSTKAPCNKPKELDSTCNCAALSSSTCHTLLGSLICSGNSSMMRVLLHAKILVPTKQALKAACCPSGCAETWHLNKLPTSHVKDSNIKPSVFSVTTLRARLALSNISCIFQEVKTLFHRNSLRNWNMLKLWPLSNS